MGSALISNPAVRAAHVVYPPSACCSGGGMYPSAPLASDMLNMFVNGLWRFNLRPVMANTSLGMAVMPRSPMRSA